MKRASDIFDRSQIERDIERAHKLRAEFIAQLVQRAWVGIKHLARRLTGIRRSTRRASVEQRETLHSTPAAGLIVSRPTCGR